MVVELLEHKPLLLNSNFNKILVEWINNMAVDLINQHKPHLLVVITKFMLVI